MIVMMMTRSVTTMNDNTMTDVNSIQQTPIKRRRSRKSQETLVVSTDAVMTTDDANVTRASRQRKPKIQASTTTEKKPIIRRRRASAKVRESRMYFNKNTCAAIVAYQQALDKKERERIYVVEIMPAFQKLVENLINVYKFTGIHDTYDELCNDCVNFLFETIRKFDASRGTNAFSYFNVVAKHFLIIKTKQKTKRVKQFVSLDDNESMNTHELSLIEELHTVPSVETLLESKSASSNIIHFLHELRKLVLTENELICINSIITIFENVEQIDLMNRTAISLYIRELSGLSTKQLSVAMHAIKQNYKLLKKQFHEIDLDIT